MRVPEHHAAERFHIALAYRHMLVRRHRIPQQPAHDRALVDRTRADQVEQQPRHLAGRAAGMGHVVVMDDFIYSEPTAIASVPEPASAILAGLAAIGALTLRWRKDYAA